MEIYYFSGTGNSLAVDRDMAETLGARLMPMASVLDEENIHTEAIVSGDGVCGGHAAQWHRLWRADSILM
jgi:flavodoxin